MPTHDAPHQEPVSDPDRVGLVWVDINRAAVVRWDEEPIVEHLEGDVVPRRRAVGSVRRGPGVPSGGGRVPGHGTEARHERDLQAFFADLAARLADLDVIEVIGRGLPHERFADLLNRLAARRQETPVVTTRAVTRRPSDAQLKARLRKLVGAELPRRLVGRYRLPATEPASPTGRPLRPAAGRRTLRPPRLLERREIAEEVELMLEDAPWAVPSL